MATTKKTTPTSDETIQDVPEPISGLDLVKETMRLQEELAKIAPQAIQALLAERAKIDVSLAQLGYIEEAPAWTKLSAKPKVVREKKSDGGQKFCKLCQTTGHDIRNHRGQPEKKPFTVEELKQF